MCEQDGVHYLAGLVSWGPSCTSRNKPGVYANVHRFVEWIKEKMSDPGKFYDYSYDDNPSSMSYDYVDYETRSSDQPIRLLETPF